MSDLFQAILLVEKGKCQSGNTFYNSYLRKGAPGTISSWSQILPDWAVLVLNYLVYANKTRSAYYTETKLSMLETPDEVMTQVQLMDIQLICTAQQL